jgi:hypothetical protein
MSASITRLTLSLGLLGVPAITAAADPADEITVQVIGDEGAKAITQQIRLPARERKAATETVRDQREALSEQRRQFEEQAREQRTDAAGGRAPGGR